MTALPARILSARLGPDPLLRTTPPLERQWPERIKRWRKLSHQPWWMILLAFATRND